MLSEPREQVDETGSTGFTIVWRVAYQRVEHPITAGEEGAAVVEGEVVIAAGKL